MVQVKKVAVSEAVLKSAYKLFKTKGYASTTTAQIAKGAGISESNLYVYFPSKMDILFDLYSPWLQRRIASLESRVGATANPRARLRLILLVLWNELPADDNGFTNNLMQALSTLTRPERYRTDLLRWVQDRIEVLVLDCLPPARRKQLADKGLAHILMMAQDGFVMGHHVNRTPGCHDETIELFCDLLLGFPP